MQLCVQNGMFTVSFVRTALTAFDTFVSELLLTAWEACRDADVLIATPSAMAGIHIAERLGVPFFYSMPFPWSSTAAFAHPMTSPQRSTIRAKRTEK